MQQKTPPMGWNSWNTFGANINEQLIFDTADKLVETGLRDLGYNYLVIDDCWSLRERGADGRIVPDPEKFPHGMKAVADYVHEKGLKFGMYSCAGNLTCAGYPGSFDHEFVDAATFAEWGVDFLKYDYCNHNKMIHGKYLYRRMGLALKNCGRDILFSACSWGDDDTALWIRETGADMWRSTVDINDSFGSVRELTEKQESILPYGGTGCYNDMDMLVVGMHGKGHVANGGMDDKQYRTHFSIWALFASPLMIGCDVRNMTPETLEILSNRELIAIDQDEGGRQVFCLNGIWSGTKNYARMLSNGDIAIGCFNFGDKPADVRFTVDELGLGDGVGKTLLLQDVWSGESFKLKNAEYMLDGLEAYGCRMFRARVVDAD